MNKFLCLILAIGLFAALAFSLLLQPAAAGPLAYTGCGGVTAPAVNADYEQQVVDRVNAVRASNNLPPLKLATELGRAARYHATDMGQDDYFQHDSYDRSGGTLVKVCDWSTRISSYYSNWQSLAENIAAGQADPQSVMNAWMNSPGHKANILSTGNWEIGVGYYKGSGAYNLSLAEIKRDVDNGPGLELPAASIEDGQAQKMGGLVVE